MKKLQITIWAFWCITIYVSCAQLCITNCVLQLLQIASIFITNCVTYYKLHHLYYKLRQVLQITYFITNYNNIKRVLMVKIRRPNHQPCKPRSDTPLAGYAFSWRNTPNAGMIRHDTPNLVPIRLLLVGYAKAYRAKKRWHDTPFVGSIRQHK